MEINNVVKLNFLNDIYLSENSFTNLYIEHIDTSSTYVNIVFSNIGPLSINGENVFSYKQRTESNPIAATLIANKNIGYNYLLETNSLTDYNEIDAFVVISKLLLNNITINDTTELTGNNLTISKTLYDEIVIANRLKDVSFYEIPEDNSTVCYIIPIKIHVGTSQKINDNGIEINNNEIKYDKSQSKFLVRTNPKLTGNIKIIVDSKNDIFFDTFNVDENTSNVKYKRKAIDKTSFLPYDINKYFSTLPKDSMYKVHKAIDNEQTNNPLDQYNLFYAAGATLNESNLYEERLSFFAPLYLGKDLPEYFIVFAIDEDTTKFNTSSIEEFIKYSRIVKSFSLKENSNIGQYLRNYYKDVSYSQNGIDIKFKEQEISKWTGIDYTVGVITNYSGYIYDYINDKAPTQYQLDNYLINGFEKYNLLSTRILNLEFLFNDNDANLNKVTSYFGFYVDVNILETLDFNLDDYIISNDIFNTKNIQISLDNLLIKNDININIAEKYDKFIAISNNKSELFSVNSIINRKVNTNHKQINLSNYYYYEPVSEFFIKQVEHETQAFTIIDFKAKNIDIDIPIELNIFYEDKNIYNLYSNHIQSSGDFKPYFSYNILEDKYYGTFSGNGNIDYIIDSLVSLLNVIEIFEAKRIDDKIIIIVKEAGINGNKFSLTCEYNDGIVENNSFGGAGKIGTQFLINNKDLNHLSGNEYFRTDIGYSAIQHFNHNFYTEYIYDKNDYKLLTLINDDEKIHIINQYVFALKQVKPTLNLLSIYQVVDFDYSILFKNVENQLLNEINEIESKQILDLFDTEEKSVTLDHNAFYKISFNPTVYNHLYHLDTITNFGFKLVENNEDTLVQIVIYDNEEPYYENCEFFTFTIGITPEMNIYIEYNNNGFDNGKYEFTLPLNESKALIEYGINKLIPITSGNAYFEINESLEDYLISIINTNGLFDLTGVNELLFTSNNIHDNLTISADKRKSVIYNKIGSIPTLIDLRNILIFENLNITNRTSLMNVISNKGSIEPEVFAVYDTYENVTQPTIVKWELENSTDINNDAYWLNVEEKFGVFSNSPDVISNTPSIKSNTFQWFLVNSILDKKYVNDELTENKLLRTDINFFSQYFYSNNLISINNSKNLYSYVYKSGDNFFTVFRGIKYKFSSHKNLDGYKFSIILKNEKTTNDIIQYKIVENSTFKNLTLCISINIDDAYIKANSLLYLFFYSYKNKLNDNAILDVNTEYKYGGFKVHYPIVPFDNNSFIKQIDDNISVSFGNKSISEYLNDNTVKAAFAYLVDDVNTHIKYGSFINDIGEQGDNKMLNVSNAQIDDKIFKLKIESNEGVTNFFTPSTHIYNLPMSLISYKEWQSYILNSGKNYYEMFFKRLFATNISEFSNNSISISTIKPILINDIYRHEGKYGIKLKNIINFNSIVKNISSNFSLKNIEIVNTNKFLLDDFYFNKLTDENLDTFVDSYKHNILKSPLSSDFYRVYNSNVNEPILISKPFIRKNIFNSPICNTLEEIEIIPKNEMITYENEIVNDEIKTKVTINISTIIMSYFSNRISIINHLNKQEFIYNNIIPNYTVSDVIVTSNNNLDTNINEINQNINIINNEQMVKFSDFENIVFTLTNSINTPRIFNIKTRLKHK